MKNKNLYEQIRKTFDFLDAENHDDWLCDNMGDPIPSVTLETFNKYLTFIIHIVKSCNIELPINIALCPNKSIDISFRNDNTPRLLINISEDKISWYGFSSTSSIPDEEYKKIFNNEIKGKSTSETPDHQLILWINKYF